MWEPPDDENLTDEEKRLKAHPEIAWIWIILLVVGLLVAVLELL